MKQIQGVSHASCAGEVFSGESITKVLGEVPLADDLELIESGFASPFGAERSGCPRYRIIKPIGYGGMGVVYEAADTYFDRRVALKVLRTDYANDQRMVERFVHEATTTAKLQHPGVAPVYDMGETSLGCPYFSMQLIHGETLAARLRQTDHSPLQRSRELGIFASVCQTIAYAHSKGIVHLDLKPSNIMVGQFGQVRVVDWGLSQNLEDAGFVSPTCQVSSPADESPPSESIAKESTASSGKVEGTLAYMSPEQARAEQVGFYSDVFGLGAILCEILTGQPPFSISSVNEAFTQAATASMEEVFSRLHRSQSEQRLIELAKACLASDPADRPCDAKLVASTISAHVERSMVHAEEDLHQFFEISMEMFCIAGLDGHFKRVNPNFTQVLGYGESELLAKPFIDFVHPEDRARTLEVVGALASGGSVVEFQNRYLDQAGRYHWFEWTAKALPEKNLVFAVARDVTERMKSQDI